MTYQLSLIYKNIWSSLYHFKITTKISLVGGGGGICLALYISLYNKIQDVKIESCCIIRAFTMIVLHRILTRMIPCLDVRPLQSVSLSLWCYSASAPSRTSNIKIVRTEYHIHMEFVSLRQCIFSEQTFV